MISWAVAASRGTTSRAAKSQDVGDLSALLDRRAGDDGRRPPGPSRRPPSPATRARACSSASSAAVRVARDSSQAERLAQTGQALVAAPDLPGAQDRQHQVDPVVAGRGAAEDVQAVADLGVLDLAQPAVDVQQEVVEAVVVGPSSRPRSWSSFAAWIRVQIWARIAGQLRRVHGGDRGVLVEQLFQPRDVAVGVGAGHRRHEVVDERGVHAALGLGALARVVDQERVDQRQVAERGVGAAGRRTGPRSCRAATPGCRACRGGSSRRRRSRRRSAARRSSGRRPGSGARAADRGRGRSRSGSRRSRAAAG